MPTVSGTDSIVPVMEIYSAYSKKTHQNAALGVKSWLKGKVSGRLSHYFFAEKNRDLMGCSKWLLKCSDGQWNETHSNCRLSKHCLNTAPASGQLSRHSHSLVVVHPSLLFVGSPGFEPHPWLALRVLSCDLRPCPLNPFRIHIPTNASRRPNIKCAHGSIVYSTPVQ